MVKNTIRPGKSGVPSERSESRDKSYTVYILRTSSDTLYIGQTNNLEKRLREHKNKSSKSAKYTRYFSSFELVYTEKYSSRTEAMRREAKLKQWTRMQKEKLIRGEVL